MAEGWIKISRSLSNHWIWKSDHRLKWWLDILLTVNHEDTKVLIRGKIVECKRGQSVMSLDSWAKRWNVTKKTVKDFFLLLQSDSMLVYESIKITTRITVCNYDCYQGEVNGQYTDSKRSLHPNKNDKNEKNIHNTGKVDDLPTKSADFIDQIIEKFALAHGNYEIVNRGKERAAASKILKVFKAKNPEANSEETLSGLTNYFGRCVKIDDPWLSQNMSLPIIVSKFNEINTILRNGKIKRNNSKATDGSTLEDVIRDQARKLGITG